MIIAHDLGTTGNKASLHTDDGRLLSAVTVGYPARFADGGLAEQDPEDWWNAVVQATRDLLARANADPAAITGLTISGQMMGAVLLDAEYRPVRPAIIWADTRSSAQTTALESIIGQGRAYSLLGHRLNPTYSLEKIMWVRDNEPDVFARVRHFCVAKDFVIHRLTGRLATDRSDASATNAYDQALGAWSPDMLAAAGLDVSLFPEILASTDVVGELTADAASATGLRRGTRVVMGGGDGPIAAVGAGIVSPSDGAYVSLGTSSWISFASDVPVYDPLMRTMTFDNVVQGSYVPTATMQAGGAALAWVSELLSPHPSSSELSALVADADTAGAASSGLYFLPYLLGERSPHWNPDASGAFLGIGRHHGRAAMTRAVLEGVAFNLFTCIQAFRESGAVVDRIDAIGGGAASDVWLQILADVWGVPVRRRSIVEEANSLGAAVTAAVGLGLVDDFGAARGLSEVTAEFTPDGSRHSDYLGRHRVFLGGYSSLESWNSGRFAR
ncbi:xylulokinase [Mycetocola manganoxydans]|uniref:Xylulose kinase n=1 Tax=Mycetocola manganoxydans TaxID=699879 RepID=A0A3L6ZZ59_9MICO|nr:xylulokinase [Mycetocola manganoxydans]RLP73018.1 xylulokinase [Mycetocola manganoxydans]GHD44515.1 xylulokinase [Mycetocola manganoxydans]